MLYLFFALFFPAHMDRSRMHDPIHHPYIRNWCSESGKRSEENRLPALRITICGNPAELGVHGVVLRRNTPAAETGVGGAVQRSKKCQSWAQQLRFLFLWFHSSAVASKALTLTGHDIPHTLGPASSLLREVSTAQPTLSKSWGSGT
jgi:hypothetical protein